MKLSYLPEKQLILGLEEYPETRRLTIDDWSIILEGIVKGVYHACDKESGWRTKIKLGVENPYCPNCHTIVPKDIDAIAATLGIT